jgi:hypothetical protein
MVLIVLTIASSTNTFGRVVVAMGADSTDSMAPTAAAEEDPAGSKSYAIYAGAYVHGKASIKTEVGEGFKTGVVFLLPPDFGATITVPFGAGSKMAFGTSFGYSTLGYIHKPESGANNSNTVKELYSYLSLYPHVNLSGFLIGVSFGFPSSGSTNNLNDSTVSMVGQVTESGPYIPDPTMPESAYDPTKYMATLIELKLGGSIPLVSWNVGRLCLNVFATYPLGGIFSDSKNYLGAYEYVVNTVPKQYKYNADLNPVVPTFSLGLQWDFRIGF